MSKSLIVIGSKPTNIYGYDTNKDGSPKQNVKNQYKTLRSTLQKYIQDNGITDVYSTLDLGAEQTGAEAAINAKANLHALNVDTLGSTVLAYAIVHVNHEEIEFSRI